MPISAFAHALRAFQSGQLGYEELASEIDRQLIVERASSAALLKILQVQHSLRPLPVAAHDAISQQIGEWPQDPTIATGLSRKSRARGVGVGDILQGRFSLVALVGEGGMSRVFKAVDLRRAEAGATDPHIAVKVLTEPNDDYFGSIVALQREAHKLQSLSHPNIVRVIDCDRDGQTVFMTMEYLAGRPLQKILRAAAVPGAPPVEPSVALAIISAVGDAVEYAHRNHIVHGDLKPGNVIVADQGEVKVIDFGMAKFIARPGHAPGVEAPNAKTPKAVTLRYASPEMAAGHDPEPADDVYALGCMAYEALSGRHPFGRQNDPFRRSARSVVPKPPSMPAHQYSAIVKALAFERQDRTPSIRRFVDDLTGRRRTLFHRRAGLAATAAAVVALLGAGAYWMQKPVRFSEPTSSAARALIAPGSAIRDCPLCPQMTVLPAGRFEQGMEGTDASEFEAPHHTVVIGTPFAMSTHEITVEEFGRFIADTRRDMSGCTLYDGRWERRDDANWQSPGFTQGPLNPVTCVSWDDAAAFAKWMSAQSGHAYRLPSASEWEYAARAGSQLARPWGTNPAAACKEANVADQSAAQRFPGWAVFPCSDHYINTAPVGSFQANAFGLNDLLGNVFEWVEDCWYDNYTGAPNDGSARVQAGCTEREMRGGSWFSAPQFVSASYRNRFDHAYRGSSIGFRLVRELRE